MSGYGTTALRREADRLASRFGLGWTLPPAGSGSRSERVGGRVCVCGIGRPRRLGGGLTQEGPAFHRPRNHARYVSGGYESAATVVERIHETRTSDPDRC